MSTPKQQRVETWLVVIVILVGLVPAAIAGLWLYMSVRSTPIHPKPQEVSTVTQSAPPPRWSGAVGQARQITRAHLVTKNLPGLSVAVAAGGDIVWAEGFGWAEIDQRVPVSPQTRFRIGTASTALTSAAVGLLLEKGRLKLDEEIQTYVPEFPDQKWRVTLRQLMAHTAGVASDGDDEGPLFSEHCERPADALKIFSGHERELRFEPGTQYRYSRYGWITVSAAIETAGNEPFLTFMRRHVFEPLAMDHTEADAVNEPAPTAASYFPRFASDPHYGPDPMRPLDYSCYAGSSVFLSTPTDMVRFAIAINSGKLLKPDTVKLLQTSQRLPSGAETGYGLGWDLETVSLAGTQTTMIGHHGDSLGGMVSSLMTFPDQGIVVSVISNISYSDTSGLAVQLAHAFAEPGQGPARN